MFNFFKKKPPAPKPSELREDDARADEASAPATPAADADTGIASIEAPARSVIPDDGAADAPAGPVAAEVVAADGTTLTESQSPSGMPPGAAAANAVALGATLPPIAPVAVADAEPVDLAVAEPVAEVAVAETPAESALAQMAPAQEAPAQEAPAEQAVPAQPAPAEAASAQAAPAQAAPEKGSWLSRLRTGLSRTGKSLSTLFVGVKVDENLFEELETALIMADAGTEATEKLLTALRARVRKDKIEDGLQVKVALRELLAEHLKPLERAFDVKRASPLVVMIAGVNGAGKTTSIGKLANTFQAQGASVLLAAGDTFRAAAREQLVEWGTRNNVSVISQEGGDPAAVSFDAVNAGRARGMGVVMVDTAGRLPTQLHLMEELKKVRRVIGKADPTAPHEVLLVIDGNTGQNALAQIRAFDAAITLTGLVVTKLDGTAKGGTLAAVAAGSQGVRPIPVYWIGVGEGMNDLQPFVAKDFAAALLAD